MIPKIIHHTAPSDKSRWHGIWYECRQSWKDNFPRFEFKFWNDEDIRNLVKSDYSEFLEMYDNLPHHIMRVDFARFCMLHKYGGIYTDMDIYCYKNFYDNLVEDIYIVESWEEWGEIVQNSLMISTSNEDFWIECMRKSKEFYDNTIKTFSSYESLSHKIFIELCFKFAGPKLISEITQYYKKEVYLLPKKLFNPIIEHQFNWLLTNPEKTEKTLEHYKNLNSKEKLIYTRHYLTGDWTKDLINK
jgi:hypothetical protein